jgi:hypothetical protein
LVDWLGIKPHAKSNKLLGNERSASKGERAGPRPLPPSARCQPSSSPELQAPLADPASTATGHHNARLLPEPLISHHAPPGDLLPAVEQAAIAALSAIVAPEGFELEALW